MKINKLKFLDGDGNPVKNGELKFQELYSCGHKPVYKDIYLTKPHHNPIKLDDNSCCGQIYLGSGGYSVELSGDVKEETRVVLMTQSIT